MPRIEVGDSEFEVLDSGDGPPLLLVHGFPLDHTMWSAQIEAFAESHRVIAPDLRGFGRSSVTIGVVSMEQHADDLAAILDALGVTQPVVFCGLSMGGYVGWAFVRKYASRLKGLIVCDSRATDDTDDARAGRMKLMESVLRNGPAPAAEAMLPKLFGAKARAEQQETVEATRTVMMQTDPEGIAAGLRGMVERPNSSDLLPHIRVPTLLVCGEEDVITPVDEMADIAAAIPDVQLDVVPDAGHMAPLEAPETVNAALRRFLSRLS